ncbi:MAG: rhomboid family intramembrane serine protease [Granulosicoccus sp.]|nr:rhomboid family intramembrane serine protease [Granulosicoccus sp.]
MLSLPKNCPVALSLIVINVLLYIGQMATAEGLTQLGLLYGPAVQQGQWWRLLSSGFLHGSLLHIGFNMYLLYLLGPQLEQQFGSVRFLLMYLGALFGGALAVMLFDFAQPTLGASAAVLGLAGTLGMALWVRGISPHRSPVFGLVVLNLALPLLVPGISFWGHFGGVVAGALMGWLLVWLPARSSRTNGQSSLLAATVAVVALALISAGIALRG